MATSLPASASIYYMVRYRRSSGKKQLAYHYFTPAQVWHNFTKNGLWTPGDHPWAVGVWVRVDDPYNHKTKEGEIVAILSSANQCSEW